MTIVIIVISSGMSEVFSYFHHEIFLDDQSSFLEWFIYRWKLDWSSGKVSDYDMGCNQLSQYDYLIWGDSAIFVGEPSAPGDYIPYPAGYTSKFQGGHCGPCRSPRNSKWVLVPGLKVYGNVNKKHDTRPGKRAYITNWKILIFNG